MKNQPNKATVKDGLPSPKPTGDFIIRKADKVRTDGRYYHYQTVCIMLQEFSDQQNAELMSEIERWKEVSELGKKSISELIKANEKLESVESENAGLLAWKESAMCELNALDLQSLGAKMGIGLGQSVSENIHAKVDGLLERVKELERALRITRNEMDLPDYIAEIINKALKK